MPALNVQSKIPLSSGDEAGVAGGVVSGTNLGEVSFRVGSSSVLIDGKPAVFHSAATAHNGSNANMPVGIHSVPSQAVVLIAP